MVDIAAASSASSQIQIDAGRSGTQENAAASKDSVTDAVADANDVSKQIAAETVPGVGEKVDVQA